MSKVTEIEILMALRNWTRFSAAHTSLKLLDHRLKCMYYRVMKLHCLYSSPLIHNECDLKFETALDLVKRRKTFLTIDCDHYLVENNAIVKMNF